MAKQRKDVRMDQEQLPEIPAEPEIKAPDESPEPTSVPEIEVPEPAQPPSQIPENPDSEDVPPAAGVDEPELPRGFRPIDSAPRDGVQIELAADVNSIPIVGFWRKTRELKQYRWHKHGAWINPHTNQRLDLFPTVWRPLNKDVAEQIRTSMGSTNAA